MAGTSTDFESFFRNKIECLLIKSSWVGAVRQKLSLQAVSQVWGERPEWYFWIAGAPGVYSLALCDAETVDGEGAPATIGRFAVKCYPYPHGQLFAGFSAEERDAVASDLFDATHTPHFEARHRIADSWFAVGSISIAMDTGRHVTLISYDSLERITTTRTSPPADGEDGRPVDVRNVAGWKIGYPLFDCLIGIFAFYAATPPCFAGATRAPGFEYVLTGGDRVECRSSRSSRHLAFSVLFAESEAVDGRAEAYWRQGMDPEEEVTFAAALGNPLKGPVKVPEMPPAAVNPLWWDLASGEYTSELASTCGCAEHEHHFRPLHDLSTAGRP